MLPHSAVTMTTFGPIPLNRSHKRRTSVN